MTVVHSRFPGWITTGRFRRSERRGAKDFEAWIVKTRFYQDICPNWVTEEGALEGNDPLEALEDPAGLGRPGRLRTAMSPEPTPAHEAGQPATPALVRLHELYELSRGLPH